MSNSLFNILFPDKEDEEEKIKKESVDNGE